jgi:sucrose phosphorylase
VEGGLTLGHSSGVTNEPANTQAPSAIPADGGEAVAQLLRTLYGPLTGETVNSAIGELIGDHRLALPQPEEPQTLCERDALLITYADQLQEPGVAPLRTLARFCADHLAGTVGGIHLLPFFPWSSDDGFSVKDYFAVAPEYGTWEDVARFRPRFDLMFDAVFNHLSAQSDWFQRFLRGEPDFADFFLTVTDPVDLSCVVRPRALPLLTEFQTVRGTEKVWTTFSADQVDLNIRNPNVLLALLKALLHYVAHGARFIRLDAIAYLCKEVGTPCIHLPQTHAVIQLFRAVLNEVAPGVQLITETNVPHSDNISYFGDGTNEAQLVYNFALPPLVLHALLRGDATYLANWAAHLQTPSARTAFFNFLASHDGIGLNPARGILPESEVEYLVERCVAHGGFISWKHNPDGSKSPYEMNIVYFDALNDPAAAESDQTQIDRFMVAQAIMLALAGVPGIYFHSLFGSRNDREAALQTGMNRRINRQKLALAQLQAALRDPSSIRARVFNRFSALLKARRNHPAFSPMASQRILDLHPAVFGLLRGNEVLCLHNLADRSSEVRLQEGRWVNLLDGTATVPGPEHTLRAYEILWAKSVRT